MDSMLITELNGSLRAKVMKSARLRLVWSLLLIIAGVLSLTPMTALTAHADAATTTTTVTNERLAFSFSSPCANGGAGEDVNFTGMDQIIVTTETNGLIYNSNYHF